MPENNDGMGISVTQVWRRINIFGNLSTDHRSVAKKLELSQMRIICFFEIRQKTLGELGDRYLTPSKLSTLNS